MYIPPVIHTSKPSNAKTKQVSSIDVADKVRATTGERRRKRDRRRKQSFITFRDRRRARDRRLFSVRQTSNLHEADKNDDALEKSNIGNNVDITI